MSERWSGKGWRKWLSGTLLVLALAAVLSSAFYVARFRKEVPLGDADMPMPGLDPGHTSYLQAAPRGTVGELWATRLEAEIAGPFAVGGERAFVACRNGFLFSLDLESGRPLWRFDAGSEIDSMPALFEGGVLVSTMDGRVVCVDGDGERRWEFEVGGAVPSSPLPFRDRVYFGSRDGFLYCVDAVSGKERWRFQADAPLEVTPCLYEGQVMCASYEGTLFALDADDGRLLWSSHLQGVPACYPVADEGRVFQLTDLVLHCADLQSGKTLWSLHLSPSPISNPAVRGNRVAVLLGGGGGVSSLVSMDARTGDRLWELPVVDAEGWTVLLVTNRDVYLAGSDKVQALEWETGAPGLRAVVEGAIPATLTVTGKRLLVGTSRRKVFCLGE